MLLTDLDALERDVLRRVAGPHQQQPLPGELVGLPEVVGVHHPAGELLNAREGRNVRYGVVTAGHYHVVKAFSVLHLVLEQVLGGDGEVVRGLVVAHVSHHGVELDVLPDVLLVPPALQVVEEDLPGWEGGDGFAKMLLEGVVGELQTLFGTVGPEVPI